MSEDSEDTEALLAELDEIRKQITALEDQNSTLQVEKNQLDQTIDA